VEIHRGHRQIRYVVIPETAVETEQDHRFEMDGDRLGEEQAKLKRLQHLLTILRLVFAERGLSGLLALRPEAWLAGDEVVIDRVAEHGPDAGNRIAETHRTPPLRHRCPELLEVLRDQIVNRPVLAELIGEQLAYLSIVGEHPGADLA